MNTAFVPSPFQERFFAELNHGRGDILLSAVAGSGKTKSIEEAVKRLPTHLHSRTLCTAFNSHIKGELEQRQRGGKLPRAVRVQTIHGLGYGVLIKHFRPADTRVWVDGNKYKKITRFAFDFVDGLANGLNKESRRQAEDAVADVVRFAMLTLADAEDAHALDNLAARYGVEFPDAFGEDEDLLLQAYALVPKIIRWGQDGLPYPVNGSDYAPQSRISYDDMVSLPVALNLPLPSYDLVFADECQDLNRAQQELLLRVRGTGRAAWIGDRNQSIYAFTGADAEAFDRIAETTGATRLPLSLCYRCAGSVIRLAQRIVPEIQACETAPEGAVISTSEPQLLALAAASYKLNPAHPFLILCRVNAPLIGAAFELIRQGVPATVKGRDIGQSLLRTLDEIAQGEGFDMSVFPSCVRAYRSARADVLSQREGYEMQLAALNDRLDSLLVVYEGLKTQKTGQAIPSLYGEKLPPPSLVSVGDMRSYITNLFADDTTGVVFSTIHKAKGLEATKVGILAPHLLPHPMAKQPGEVEQERNLCYVAITRAREELYIAGQIGFFGQGQMAF